MKTFGPKLTLIKGGKENLVSGVITTKTKDLQGQTIDPSGVQYEDFLSDGVVNWHHLTIGNPETIIGKPKDVFMKSGALHGITELFDTPLANKVKKLMRTLERYGRNLSYSLEGEVIQKAENDPSFIQKSLLFGLAITPYPINKQAKISLVKGLDFNEEIGEFACMVGGDGSMCVKSKGEVKEILFKALYDLYEGFKAGLVSQAQINEVKQKIKKFKHFM